MGDGAREALPVKCLYWKEGKESMQLEESSAFSRDWGRGVPLCSFTLLLPAKQRPGSTPQPCCLAEQGSAEGTSISGVPSP